MKSLEQSTKTKKKKEKQWKDIGELLNLSDEKLNKKERKRVKDWKALQKKKLPTHACAACDKQIPKPMEYCSSKCRREHLESKKKT